MKTSLGIWALGPMITRFVPGGYQPEHGKEPMPEKVHRAVTGLGDLMDDYEFHYPGELNRDNLDEVRSALDGHGIYAVAGGLHVDRRFAKGGLTALDDSVRAEALRLLLEAADLAGDIEAQMIVWPGGEGYNYPFRCRTPRCGRACSTGSHRSPSGSRRKADCSFSSTELGAAMKIHMSNIGMTLHVIHKLRDRGIDNVKVNMDWQHLIMNGEHPPEYAALLAAEGLLGHQHANDGWGTFDDDNMVGTIRFMETVELASSCAARTTARTASGSASTSTVHRGSGRGGEALRPPLAVHRRRRGTHRRGGAAARHSRARTRSRVRGRVCALGA